MGWFTNDAPRIPPPDRDEVQLLADPVFATTQYCVTSCSSAVGPTSVYGYSRYGAGYESHECYGCGATLSRSMSLCSYCRRER